MREIKFRGKRLQNGEWVLGSLLQVSQKECYIVVYNDDGYIRYEVDPETVGQFTGLYDKNNKKIYENDIIELTEKLIDGSGKTTYVGNVVYQNACFHFRMDKINYIILGYVDKKQIKIIGNIHDNPELLKGGEK